MANELQGSYVHGATVYALLRNRNSQIWNNATSAFENYSTGSYSGYPITATEQGAASAYYAGSIPASVPPGTYAALFKSQQGANPAETDPTVDAGPVDWNGTNVAQLSDIAISGSVLPIQLQRGAQILNYPIYLKSSADHVTPFTSGIISGQISKNGGAFGVLQSGAYTEVGHGVYSLQALTSGDTSCNTMALLFTGVGISGGACDPLLQTFILQHASGF